MVARSCLTWIAEQQECYADMLSHSLKGLELSRAAGDRTLEVMSLDDAGWSHALLGDYRPSGSTPRAVVLRGRIAYRRA